MASPRYADSFETELRAAMADGKPVAVAAKDCGFFDTGLLQRRGATMAAVEVPSLAGYLADELDRSLAAGGVAARRLAAALQIKLPK